MDNRRIRDESIRTARQLGVDLPTTLPLLDVGLEMRSTDEVVSRILAMNAVAATAYGFDKAKAIAWLKQEGLTDSLTEQERRFVFEGVGQPNRFSITGRRHVRIGLGNGNRGRNEFRKGLR